MAIKKVRKTSGDTTSLAVPKVQKGDMITMFGHLYIYPSRKCEWCKSTRRVVPCPGER